MAEVIFGVAGVLLGIFILWEAAQLPRGVLSYALDPALFPQLVALGLIVLGIALLLSGRFKKVKQRLAGERKALFFRLFLLLAITVIYILMWDRGWFLLNTFLYLLGIHLICRFSLLPSVGSSFLVTLATYLLFTQVFRVRLF